MAKKILEKEKETKKMTSKNGERNEENPVQKKNTKDHKNIELKEITVKRWQHILVKVVTAGVVGPCRWCVLQYAKLCRHALW